MAIPKSNELFTDVLRVLSDEKEYKTPDLKEIIVNQLNLTDEERKELLPSKSDTVIKNRIGWAITSLKKAEFVESKRRGYVNITKIGMYEFKLNSKITEEVLWKNPAYVEWKGEKPLIHRNKSAPEEQIEKSYNFLNKKLSEELLDKLIKSNPFFFEKVVVDLLLKMGYGDFKSHSGFITSKTNDEGIDGIINQDILGFDKIAVQAKRYNKEQKIGRPLLQSFAGSLIGKGLSKGIFITTSSFNDNAIEFVNNQVNLNIVLIDGKRLSNLMIQYDLGTSIVDTYIIKRIDTDYFNIDE